MKKPKSKRLTIGEQEAALWLKIEQRFSMPRRERGQCGPWTVTGLCSCLYQSNGDRAHGQRAWDRLLAHQFEVNPRDRMYWWPLTKAGDAARRAFCRRMAREALKEGPPVAASGRRA